MAKRREGWPGERKLRKVQRAVEKDLKKLGLGSEKRANEKAARDGAGSGRGVWRFKFELRKRLRGLIFEERKKLDAHLSKTGKVVNTQTCPCCAESVARIEAWREAMKLTGVDS